MSFKRIAISPIGVMPAPAGDKLVFSNDNNEPVSFDYQPENFVYFRCRAITADQSNGNGDYFPEEEILKAYKSFIGVGLYKDHNSDSVDKSIGKVLWAEWVPNGKYVECYCAVDKILAPELAHRVKMGIATSVSMGCSVAEAECSICHNTAHNVNELCDCMAPGFGQKGRKNRDGSTIYEINRGIQFNELSLVTVPADPTARIFEIYAGLKKSASINALENLKKLYVFHYDPSIYKQPAEEQEIVRGRGKGDTEVVYDEPRKRDAEQKMEYILNTPGVLTDEELNNFRKWIATSGLPSGGAGPKSDISEESFVNAHKNSGKRLWQLAAVDEGPEHKKSLEYFRRVTDDGKGGVEKVNQYYSTLDDAISLIRNRDKALSGKGINPDAPEYKEAIDGINSRVVELLKHAHDIELDLLKNHKKVNNEMRKNYDAYSLYRGYTDVAQGENPNLPPIENVISEIEEGGISGKKVFKAKEEFNRLKNAWSTISSEPYEKVRDNLVSDPAYAIGAEGVTDESIKRVFDIKTKTFDASEVAKSTEKLTEVKKEIDEKTEGLSDKPFAGSELAHKKKDEAEKRREERELKKMQEENKKLEQFKPIEQTPPAKPVPSWEHILELVSKNNIKEAVNMAQEGQQLDKLIDAIVDMKDQSSMLALGEESPDSKQKMVDKLKAKDPQMAEELSGKLGLSTNANMGNNNKVVIKIDNSMEEIMGLSINYTKGASLETSYFEAKQGTNVYRAAASDVLPLAVQDAIKQNDTRVATPDQIVSDLAIKYSTLDGFKAWAKKRKKKNKKALLRMMPKEDLAKKMEPVKSEPVVSVSDTENGRNNEMLKENAIPKSAAQETEKPATPVTETPKEETIVVETAPEVTEAEKITSIKSAFDSLAKFVESKLAATAVQTVKMEAKVDGVAKAQTAPEPKGAIKEVTKTENPKGHVATSALKAEAMDENWTVNQKELEAQPKAEKLQQAAPPTVSWDLKEMGSEEVSVKNSNKAAGKVKKYYNQLGPGAEGTPELAMDLKSSENGEVKLLREALAKEQAEKAALLEKDRLQTVADKIYTIVATLREKNLITAGKENVLIDTLTQRFAETGTLESLNAVVDVLTGTPATTPETEDEVENKVVPQVFDTVETGSQDPAELMSEIWNK